MRSSYFRADISELASFSLESKALTSPIIKALAQHSRPLRVLLVHAGTMRGGGELQALLRQVKTLESLEIACVASFPLFPAEVLPGDCVVLPALTALKLNFAKEECFQRLSFPNLTSLSLSHSLFLRDLASVLVTMPALSTFVLSCEELPQSWIQHKQFAHVRELDLECNPKQVPEFVAAFPGLIKLHFRKGPHVSTDSLLPLSWLHEIAVVGERGGLQQLEELSLISVDFAQSGAQSTLHGNVAQRLITALPKLNKMESAMKPYHAMRKALKACCKAMRRPMLFGGV